MEKRERTEMAVRSSVLQLDCSKGHLRWSVNDVARASKVSRSLVYYYFGKTKKEIFFNSLQAVVDDFYGLSEAKTRDSKESKSSSSKSEGHQKLTLFGALLKTCLTYKANPHFAVFFQKWRHKPSEVQAILVGAESAFEKKIQAHFPRATPAQVKGIHAIFHGLATAPYLDEAALRAAFDLVNISSLRMPR